MKAIYQRLTKVSLSSQALANRKFVRLDENVRRQPGHDQGIIVFVLVVGETARAMNFSLNGYGRETNPRLGGEDVVNFSDVAASGTATAIFLPAMFSVMPRKKFNLNDAIYSENIRDLLSSAGYDVIWLENDDGCKKVCSRVTTIDVAAMKDPRYREDGYCHDEALIDPLEDILNKLERDTVIVLHTIGSHGPSYYKRHPEEFKVFHPTCDTSEVQN
ncbi:hypothetical protein C4J81_13575 [Deltaproteobacteria bacterium Smac51]|nr:hypothetical protein C4J81_13575 [Deltaproteobacteria bacterium Smac51]